MKNKKILIPVIICILIIAIVVVVFVVLNNKKNTDESSNQVDTEQLIAEDDTVLDYNETIEKFAEACKSDEEMDNFVNNYVGMRALYATKECEKPEDFEEKFEQAAPSDYRDQAFEEDIKNSFKEFVTDGEITVKEIGELGKNKNFTMFDEVEVLFVDENTSEEITLNMILYRGRLLAVEYDYGDETEENV